MKSHWKRSEIFEDIFEDFEPPSQNFLATPLHTTTASEELAICSSIVVVVTSVQLVVGRIALFFILVYSFSIIKQKNIKNKKYMKKY